VATNYRQKGDTITLTAPANLKSGDGFMVGSLFAVAAYDALSGAEVEGHVVGVFVLPKPNSVVTFNLGEKVFWDNSMGLCKASAAGYYLIGLCTAAAGATDAVVSVRLDGTSVSAIPVS
jgi:predicted RecA/RadA family phage recombinase